MISDNINLNDVIKIRQLRSKNTKRDNYETNRNFEEFREVYKGVFSGDYENESLPSVSSNPYGDKRDSSSSKGIKTLRLEWPLLGAEEAILPPRDRNRLPPKKGAASKGKPKPKFTQDTWSNSERDTSKTQSGIISNTKILVDKANEDARLAATQLEQIRTIMKNGNPEHISSVVSLGNRYTSKQSEKSKRRPKSPPSCKARKKYDRHYDCINKKYMATLTTMKQKLQRLEEKYFKRPHVVYKNVRDIFTQPSNVEIIYRNNHSSEEVKIEEVFRGIKMDLDAIANTRVDEEFAKDMHLTKQYGLSDVNEKKVSYSEIIDRSESKLKRMRSIRQNIVDVEAFCDNLCKIGEEDGASLRLSSPKGPEEIQEKIEKKSVMFDDTKKGIFDGTELQKSVSKSSYLTKEFSMEGSLPSIKIFSDSDSFIRNRTSFLETGDTIKKNRKKPSDHSITSLIENLNMALNNSLYKPVT